MANSVRKEARLGEGDRATTAMLWTRVRKVKIERQV